MRIDAIHIENFLSFDTFAWDRLDPALNVLVGPNGAGKTNLFHALRAVRSVVRRLAGTPGATGEAAGSSQWMWEHVRHRGDDQRPTRIAVDLTLSLDRERDLLATFMAAALFQPQAIQSTIGTKYHVNAAPEGLHRLADWLERMMPAAISWLLTGRLVVASRDGGRNWDCHYEAQPNASPFWWDLQTPGIRGQAAPTSTSVSSLFDAWSERLETEVQEHLFHVIAGRVDGSLPHSLAIDDLPLWVRPEYDKPLGTGEWGFSGPRPRLFDHVDQVIPATHASWQGSGWHASGSHVWRALLDRAWVFTDNVRAQPKTMYTVRGLHEAPLDLSDGRDLAAFLRRKKVGGSDDRLAYSHVQELFTALTGRRFEAVEPKRVPTPSPLGSQPRGTEEEGDESQVAVALVVADEWDDVPLAFSGAGIAEALYFSTLAAGSTGQVILLDEPALNLHPTLMAKLLDVMLGNAGLADGGSRPASQFLVSTHSPWLVPSDAVDRVARFTLVKGHTTLHALNSSPGVPPDDAQLVELRNLLRRSPAARALLFSRAVLLVEGETELGALPVWWHLDRQDVALYAVGGKGNFVAPVKFLERFDIPWAVLCDGDAIWDRKHHGTARGAELHVQAIVRAFGKKLRPASGDPGADRSDFLRWRKRLERFGIFTLADCADQGFERAVQAHTPAEVWERAHELFDGNKVAVGRYVSEQCACPSAVQRLLSRIVRELRARGADLEISQ